MKKSLLSIVLSLALALSILPVGTLMSYADETEGYGLFISGYEITPENKGDILGFLQEKFESNDNAYVSADKLAYNPDTNTLSITNLYIEGKGTGVIEYTGSKELKIIARGDNFITNYQKTSTTGTHRSAIFAPNAAVTINATKSMGLYAGKCPGNAAVVCSSLTVDTASAIYVYAEKYTLSSGSVAKAYGIDTKSLTVNSGQLWINAPTQALRNTSAGTTYVAPKIKKATGMKVTGSTAYFGDTSNKFLSKLDTDTLKTMKSLRFGAKKTPTCKLSASKLYYNGKVKRPSVTTNSDGKVIRPNSVKPGIYEIEIAETDTYDPFLAMYEIAIKPTSIGSLTKADNGFTVKVYKRDSAMVSGYQVRYSTKSSMANATTKTIGTKSTSVTKKITKLKDKTKYYVQVRTYKTIDGEKNYSKWSSKKYVTTK